MNIFRSFIHRWSITNRVSLERLTVAIAMISVISIIASYALYYKLNTDFVAVNGAYQTFNPIRRIFDGEIPELNFNVYLGIGTTYLITSLAFLIGKNFAAVNFSSHFLHLFCHFLAFLTLFYLLGASLRRSLFFASGIVGSLTLVFGLITISGDWPLRHSLESLKTPFVPSLSLLDAWTDLFTPGLSNLGLRSALPFLTSLCILLGIHYLQSQKILLIACWGILVGLQPLWSNDYGLISSLILFIIASIYILKFYGALKKQAFLILTASAITVFLLATSMITYGHPEVWIQNNLLGIANDQFWYYGIADSKVFSPSEILSVPFLYYYGILLCFFSTYTCFIATNIRPILLLYIALTTFGAGVVSCIGGGVSIRYFIPAFFVSYFVIAFIALLLIKKSIYLLLKRHPSIRDHFTYIKSRLPNAFLKKVLAFLMIGFYVTGIGMALKRIPPVPNTANYFYVEKLGGWLSNAFSRSVEIANQIKQETHELPPQRRILSTYASVIDTLADSKNASGVDYIIHALGEAKRQQYQERYRAAMPEYITTIREDYSNWENWIRRVNWWFYQEFIPQYHPVDATFYNLIWKRNTQPRFVPSSPVQCEINPQKSNSVNLVFSSNLQDQASISANSIYYVDVELNYVLAVRNTGIPLIGNRGIVNATEVKVAVPQGIPSEGVFSYGMPPHHQHWHIPLIHRLGELSVLNLKGYPKDRATLQVFSCKARLLAPKSEFELVQETTPQNVTDADWKNGIAMNRQNQPALPSKAGFLFANPAPQTLLIPGMMVEFAQGGARKIVAFRGREVWVTGDALDPVMDGYPHSIKLRIK